jgi:hypothetical protein
MADYSIVLVGGASEEAGVLSTTEDEDRCHIFFAYRNCTIEAEATDYFEAFCLIRLQLESGGLIPSCYGASLNVYPSGMARDMGAGLKAYKLEIGKHSRRPDLVHIFATGPDVVAASVKSQREFFEEWVATPMA